MCLVPPHATPMFFFGGLEVCLDADGSGTTLAWGDTGVEVRVGGKKPGI